MGVGVEIEAIAAESSKEEMRFQAETTDLLNLMINSIYTHKQIFLRELLSNACDALDKIRFLALTDKSITDNESYGISLELDKEKGILTVSDNGIGMSFQEVIDNIGTIARSGTRNFVKQLGKGTNLDLIGQFGVGFYSAFMVAKKVSLLTRKYDEREAVLWESDGLGTFTIEKAEKERRGTSITLHLRDDAVDAKVPENDFSNQYTIRNLVEEYSNYIQYPIRMDMTRQQPVRDKSGNEVPGGEWETIIENKILNSMVPLWKKDKKTISAEEYFKFYKHHYKDWNEYADVIHLHAEGKAEYYSLLFIPSQASSDLYSKDFAKGIQLYCNSIFVMNDCKDLLPHYLKFVRGLVDSNDLSLNISREVLQHNTQLKTIGSKLEKKVLAALGKMLKDKRPLYEKIWGEFGKSIKGGIYMDMSAREKLRDLLLFRTSHKEDGFTTLREYVDRMPEGQSEIYYAANKDLEAIRRMPQLEMFRDRNVEVLFFTDKVDEFMIENLGDYEGKKVISVTREDFGIDELSATNNETGLGSERRDGGEGDGSATEGQSNSDMGNEQLLGEVKKVLGEKVVDVKLSKRLKSSPVCLVATNKGSTFNMEQLLKGANQVAPKARKILEINPSHPLFGALQNTYASRDLNSEFANCCELMYYQALLVEGYELDNPVEFSALMSNLMVKAFKYPDEKNIH